MRNPLRRLVNRDRPLGRRGGIAPLAPRRDTGPVRMPTADDYLVEGDQLLDQPSTAARIVNTLQILLIFVMAVLSLAVVWLLGTVLNVL